MKFVLVFFLPAALSLCFFCGPASAQPIVTYYTTCCSRDMIILLQGWYNCPGRIELTDYRCNFCYDSLGLWNHFPAWDNWTETRFVY